MFLCSFFVIPYVSRAPVVSVIWDSLSCKFLVCIFLPFGIPSFCPHVLFMTDYAGFFYQFFLFVVLKDFTFCGLWNIKTLWTNFWLQVSAFGSLQSGSIAHTVEHLMLTPETGAQILAPDTLVWALAWTFLCSVCRLVFNPTDLYNSLKYYCSYQSLHWYTRHQHGQFPLICRLSSTITPLSPDISQFAVA